MTRRWLISSPVWGEAYARRFLDQALPSQLAALAYAGMTARWLVHTDRPEVTAAMAGLEAEIRPVPQEGDLYRRFGDAHRETIDVAADGDAVVLLTADIVVSRETFAASAARFDQGFKAIVAAATRTLSYRPAPIGASAPDLLDWTMEHPHPMVAACFWGERSNTPWAVYFRQGGRTILRGLHLHPLAVIKDRDLRFEGTLDQGLLDRFRHPEIHCVTDRYELAMAELSPAERRISLRGKGSPMTAESIAEWASTRAHPVHWWLSTHRIVIQGDAGPSPDIDVWPRVLASPHAPQDMARADLHHG